MRKTRSTHYQATTHDLEGHFTEHLPNTLSNQRSSYITGAQTLSQKSKCKMSANITTLPSKVNHLKKRVHVQKPGPLSVKNSCSRSKNKRNVRKTLHAVDFSLPPFSIFSRNCCWSYQQSCTLAGCPASAGGLSTGGIDHLVPRATGYRAVCSSKIRAGSRRRPHLDTGNTG